MNTKHPIPSGSTSCHDYASLHSQFQWRVPKAFNIAKACAPKTRAEQSQTALIIDSADGALHAVTAGQLWQQSQQLANAFCALGALRGDRIAIVLPQVAQTPIAHLATYALGAVAMPMSVLFGPDALAYRLENAEAKIVIIEPDYLPNLHLALADMPDCARYLKAIIVVEGDGTNHETYSVARLKQMQLATGIKHYAWATLLSQSQDHFTVVKTLADDAAILIYTSGTTGPPKGAVIPHRALIGNLTGFVASQNWFPQARDVFWSPADWAWTGGLMDALLPSLYFKKPIVGYRGRFSPDVAYELLEKHAVTNSFLFPTALKQMMKAEPQPQGHYKLKLRAIMSAGESVGQTLFDWTQDAFGVTTNEMFGQTEVNYIVGNSAQRWPAKSGSIGKAYPGHQVEVINEEGLPVADGELGEIAVNQFDIHGHADPVFFLGYWKNESATRDKFTGNWCRTGDLATRDSEGYLWYGGRADDMFKAAGYRIGPSEIENCLVKHPSVANAAVVPKPDKDRGNVVKAFVVLSAGVPASALLVQELQAHVRGKLAPYEYPKEIEFIDALPMTTTGKVQRRILRLQEEAKFTSDQSTLKIT
jgi:acetyl-CoA synthetase